MDRRGCGPLLAVILGILLALAAIGSIIKRVSPPAKPVAVATPTGPNSFQVEVMARGNLGAALKDRDSMDVRDAMVPNGAGYLCGMVNSRNGFGGMTGYKRFIAGASPSMPVVIEGETIERVEFDKLWTSLRCG